MPARRDTEERLAELIEKKAQLDAQIASLDARRRLTEKKDDDRLRWLLGSLAFDLLPASPALQEIVRKELPARLTDRDQKRGLWQKLFPQAREDQL